MTDGEKPGESGGSPSPDTSIGVEMSDSRLQAMMAAGKAMARGSSPGGWLPPMPEELQAEIPQYKVLDLMGRGGMGAVYRGWQVSLERYVAIKILPPGADDGDLRFAERFKQEAKVMAKFQHPGIVSVYDAGETAGGLLYIVMEFIEGTDVAQMLLANGALPADHALAITAHVCDALHYAHTHGVIHRDIKPANIMVNREGQVKVADFGLAKASGPAGHSLTHTDMRMGTPDFIAPEALVTGMQVDQRADLYAVGVMFYNMLSGKVPRGVFLPASRITGSDPRFDAIITKAMQTEREYRYQSAVEMRRDLDVVFTTPIEMAAPPRQPERAPRKPNTGKIAAVLGGIAALGIGAFFVFHKTEPAKSTISPATQSPVVATAAHQPGVEPLEKFLVGTKWHWLGLKASKDELEFLGDGTVEMADWTRQGLLTGWKQISPNEVELTVLQGRDKNTTARIVFADDRSSFTGLDFDGKRLIGKSPRIP